ncbi:MAG TPA: hypothetical protein VHL59_01830 [Thermoanaerobaculia bacterium]|nr:hypothetical protein [Thermoanaerobaculia bacterium]
MAPPVLWPDPDHALAFYERYFDHLFDIATVEFNLPPDCAENLVHNILLSFLRRLDSIDDPDAWLLGAITTAATRETPA